VTEPDQHYTIADHEFRDDDAYAIGKYRLTARWLDRLPIRGSLLNVGCGAGQFNELAVGLGYEVRAFEPDPAAFALARAACPPGCEISQVGLDEIPGIGIADVIVMHDVLEHLADDRAAVTRLGELLAPGGLLIVSVPAMPRLFGYHDEQLGHFRRYTRRTLRGALEPSFTIERLRSYGTTMIPITAWYSRLRRRPYPTAGASGGGLVAGALDLVCRIEERVPGPLGTSLVCRARLA
jgi:SAM-dependent methyltransferase